MGFLDYGQGAQAFMDNFLKTKLGLEEGNRQQLEAARRQEMFLQKQREQQEYAELMSKINSPATAEVQNPNAFNVVSNNKPVPNDFLNFVQTGQNPQGFLQPQDNNPTIQKQFPSQVEAWKAQKLDPEREIFNRSLGIQTKYDPTEALKTRASLIRTDENNETKMKLLEDKLSQSLAIYNMTNDFKWKSMAQEAKNDLELLRAKMTTPNINIINRGNGNADRTFGTGLRKEYNNLPEVKEANTTMPKIENMEKAYSQSLKSKNFVAVDQALITLFNKLTDPNSVVRESEYARTAQNIPLLNAIKGKAEKVIYGGAGLTVAERNELMKMARSFRDTYKDVRRNRMNEYRGYATSGGVDPNGVFVDAYDQQPTNSGFNLDNNAIDAELKRRKGK